MEVEYTIQTNGTLIDDEFAAFFAEHRFLVGVSVDGPPALHDRYRVDRGGAPTSERVLRGLERLRAHGVEFNTLTALHAANADHPLEVYRYLRDDLGSRFLQLILVIERLPAPRIDVPLADLGLAPGLAREAPWRSWRDRPLCRQEGRLVTDRSITPDQYGAFLVAVFDEWVRRDIGEVFVRLFDVTLANLVGASRRRCASTPRRAAPRSRWSTTATSTVATTSSRRGIGWATSPRRRWQSSWHRTPSVRSGWRSATRCRPIAAPATYGGPATAAAPGTGSSTRPTGSRA